MIIPPRLHSSGCWHDLACSAPPHPSLRRARGLHGQAPQLASAEPLHTPTSPVAAADMVADRKKLAERFQKVPPPLSFLLNIHLQAQTDHAELAQTSLAGLLVLYGNQAGCIRQMQARSPRVGFSHKCTFQIRPSIQRARLANESPILLPSREILQLVGFQCN